MKKNITLLMALVSISAFSQVTDVHVSETIELISNASGNQTIVPNTEAFRSASLTGTKFIIDGIDEIPLEAYNSLLDACKYWEEILDVDTMTMRIKVEFVPMSGDSLVKARIYYANPSFNPASQYPYLPNTHYPFALLRHFNEVLPNDPDILISFNNNLDLWFFGGKMDYEVPSGKHDFTTYTMRMIAKGLGFYSNKQLYPSENMLLNPRYVFDRNLVNNSNESLNAITVPAQIKNFMTSDNVFWKQNTGYKLYAPAIFDQEKSVQYFHVNNLVNESEKSPMAQTIKKGESSRKIGSSVLSVLYDMGWTKPVLPIEITSQLSENSNVRMGLSYQFAASLAANMLPSSCIWSFEVMKGDGLWESKASSSGSTSFTFTIPTITDLDFARATNGAIRSRVKVQTLDANNKVYDATFYLLLLARPEQPIVRIKEISPYGDWSKNVVIEFLAEGATQYGVVHEDIGYFSSGEFIISSGEYQEYTIGNVYDDGYHRFVVRAFNQYGESSAWIYYDNASFNNNDQELTLNQIDPVKKEIEIKSAMIFNSFGQLQKSTAITNQSINVSDLKGGIYIIKATDSNGNIYSSKFIKK
jgi:hypothetical protein